VTRVTDAARAADYSENESRRPMELWLLLLIFLLLPVAGLAEVLWAQFANERQPRTRGA